VAKLHLVSCAVLSQQNAHSEAIDHAKYGVLYSHQTILETKKIAENFQKKSDDALLFNDPESFLLNDDLVIQCPF